MSNEKANKGKSKAKGTPKTSNELRQSSNQGQDASIQKQEQVKATIGRPSEYTEEKGAEFCKRVAGGRMVRDVCNDADMPAAPTFYRWLETHDDFRKQYARAKEIQADAMAADILKISDTSDADNVCDEYGNIKPNHEWIARSKLRVDSRKWLLSKMMPKKYGDKVEQTIVGDPERPQQHNHTVDIKAMNAEQLKEFIRQQTHD
jgi:SHS2 domain-containing protein